MHPELIEIADKDGRYAWEAYSFVLDALSHTQRMFGKSNPAQGQSAGPEHHVTARELLEGICSLARQEFGLMAPVVFDRWGIRRTDDFGEIIFTLIHASVLFKNEDDRREDFNGVFDLHQALTDEYPIVAEESGRWSSR